MNQPKIISKISKDNHVILLESDSNYTIIHLKNGEKLVSGYSLSYYEKITDNQYFMRLNRSIMVNKSFVEFIDLPSSELVLNNGRKVSISRRRMKAFQEWI